VESSTLEFNSPIGGNRRKKTAGLGFCRASETFLQRMVMNFVKTNQVVISPWYRTHLTPGNVYVL
jgi:hypothetical protein